MNAAIEAAARAIGELHGDGEWEIYVDDATAAIIAFLRECEVTPEMIDTGNRAFDVTDTANATGQDMSKSEYMAVFDYIATELEGK